MSRPAAERCLTDEELHRFMESVRIRRHVNQPRDHAFFAILANTGLRPSEVLALTRADVHLGASPPWIRVKRMKKGAIDELCVPEGVVVPLRTYLQTAPAGLLFPFHRRMAQRKFVFYARHAGVDGHRLYDLRHTAATRLHRLTKDIGLVQRLLGHANPDTTAIYIHIGRAQQKEAVERMGAVT